MKYRFDIEQNTEEWFDIKLGKFSASIADKLLSDKKSVGYKSLINKIIEERMTNQPCESKAFQGNPFTDRGHELEPVARADYEMRTFSDITLVGVVELDDWILCSPDGLIGENGLYQAKCPIFNTQREYLRKQKIPINYIKQMQFEMFVTGREFNIFNSYHPYLAPVDIILKREEAMISFIKERIEEAKMEVIDEIDYLESLKK